MKKTAVGQMVVLAEHEPERKRLEEQGVLPCDGRTLSREEYHDLYEVIGTQYGDSKEGFKLPDCSPLRYGIISRE